MPHFITNLAELTSLTLSIAVRAVIEVFRPLAKLLFPSFFASTRNALDTCRAFEVSQEKRVELFLVILNTSILEHFIFEVSDVLRRLSF